MFRLPWISWVDGSWCDESCRGVLNEVGNFCVSFEEFVEWGWRAWLFLDVYSQGTACTFVRKTRTQIKIALVTVNYRLSMIACRKTFVTLRPEVRSTLWLRTVSLAKSKTLFSTSRSDARNHPHTYNVHTNIWVLRYIRLSIQ